MSKYIRTKNNIYKVRKPLNDEYLWDNRTYVYGHETIENKSIIAQADTIEELCDGFVWCRVDYYDSPEKNPYRYIRDIFALELSQKVIKENGKPKWLNIYGAIWTDKGLIYVAKMNEKGELELL